MQKTKEQVTAYVKLVAAIAEIIREVEEIPSGHLYAQVMAHLSLEQYTAVIAALKKAELVKESGYLLTWIGPK